VPRWAQLLPGCLSVLAPYSASTLASRRLARVLAAPDQKTLLGTRPLSLLIGRSRRPLSVVVVDVSALGPNYSSSASTSTSKGGRARTSTGEGEAAPYLP
jgi:hypothetical protein